MTDEEFADIYRSTHTIAVVGASTDDSTAAHVIPAYLQSEGFRIIPVNPTADAIFGEPTVASLADITGPVDVVDVFRPAAEAPGIARQAVAIGARVLWLQIGIESEEAAQIARDGGLVVVMNTCMGATHTRLRYTGVL